MTRQLSVMILGDSPDSLAQSSVLATLPLRFRIVRSASDADILLVTGSYDSASQAIALMSSRHCALFIASPAQLSTPRLDALCAAAGERPVMFGVAAASALGTAALDLLDRGHATPPVIVDCAGEVRVADAALLRTSLLEQLMLLEALGGRATSLETLVMNEAQVIASATLDNGWSGVRLAARHGIRERITVRTVSRTLRREVTISPTHNATAAEVAVFDSNGRRESMPLFQSGYRQCWIDLYAAIEGHDIAQRAAAVRRNLSLIRTMDLMK
jgi:hypothetical protein